MKRKISVARFIARVFFFCFFAVTIYLLAQVFFMTKPSYIYETVISYEYTDSILSEGYVLFDETWVEGTGSLGYIVEEGARVSAAQTVAECYANDTQWATRARLKKAEDMLFLLHNSENTAGSLIDHLVTQRRTALYDMLDQLDQGQYVQIEQNSNAFLLAQNKLQITTGEQSDYANTIVNYTEQVSSLESALSGLSTIQAPTNGYFVSNNIAQFLPLNQEELSGLSVAQFADTLASTQAAAQSHLAGKVVSSYTWYFMGACTLEESALFRKGTTLDVTFPDKTTEVFPAKVISIEQDEASGLARITLQCEYIGVDALSLGRECAQIIFKTYEGLRVPADAVRMQEVEDAQGNIEYVNGIYVAYNGIAKFRKIEKIYETAEYILVPLEGTSTHSQVKLYDQVIISGTDLSDGKLL